MPDDRQMYVLGDVVAVWLLRIRYASGHDKAMSQTIVMPLPKQSILSAMYVRHATCIAHAY